MSDAQGFQIEVPQEIVQYWGWFLAFGIGLVVLGIAAIARSFRATIVTMLFFGWLLIIASGLEIVQSLMVGHWAAFFHHLFAAVLFGVAGILLITKPIMSAETLTLFMGLFFLIGGIFQFVTALVLGSAGWEWQALDGGITFVLGMLVVSQWPISGLWAIGLFLGIDLVFYGAAWIAVALSLRAA
ncbi:DUF308 domain-containing protein [Bradyrhizobium sp. ARR65]|uniref:HdeD family acid-resistance protein n=1 Tax=Bradyrhizobium sp. ARR65 TaxID=1040989 RepID=UPI0004672858|nr:DUF308 domain-containing protein [Bradyrhizobium sp. ARR65]